MLPDIIQKQYPVLRSWLEHREAFQIREDDMATSVKQMMEAAKARCGPGSPVE